MYLFDNTAGSVNRTQKGHLLIIRHSKAIIIHVVSSIGVELPFQFSYSIPT